MADNALARALMLNQSPAQQKTTGLPLYGALSDTGGGAPSIAQQLARALLNVPTAISEAFKGNSYGSADPNNAIADAARQQFWRGSVFGVPEDVTQRNLQRATNIALAAPTVYHGSPHKFDAFDSSKIGTGEGAQAYGHGLYFAESPEVATSYAGANKGRAAAKDGWIDSLPAYKQMDVYNILQKNLPDNVRTPMLEELRPRLGEDVYQEVKSRLNSTNLYTVDLPDAMAAKMLDWDKPLSQQPQNVQDALRNYPFTHPLPEGAKGEDIHLHLALDENNKATAPYAGVADQLRSMGIPGIRYLDQGSRGAGQGTYNYVAFPGTEGALKILERK